MSNGRKKPRVVRPASSGTPKKERKFSLFGTRRAITDEVKKKKRIKAMNKYK